MKFALAGLLFATFGLASAYPLGAAMLWTVGIAFLHMVEETRGKLWAYFGETVNFPLLQRLPTLPGFLLIVAPAFVLQATASYFAFNSETVCVFWLAVLIGARLGDGVFSHAIPFARGQKPLAVAGSGAGQLNPGLATGIIYLVDGLLLLALFQSTLFGASAGHLALKGFAVGAGFFALVLPGLQILGKLIRK